MLNTDTRMSVSLFARRRCRLLRVAFSDGAAAALGCRLPAVELPAAGLLSRSSPEPDAASEAPASCLAKSPGTVVCGWSQWFVNCAGAVAAAAVPASSWLAMSRRRDASRAWCSPLDGS